MRVRSTVCDGLADDAGAGLELPQRRSSARVDGLEPTVHRSIERDVSAGDERSAPDRQVLLNGPNDLTCLGVPRRELSAMAAWTSIHLHVHSDVRSASDVVGRDTFFVHTQILMRDI